MQINDISETFPLYSTALTAFIASSRCMECPNIRQSLGNGFPMKNTSKLWCGSPLNSKYSQRYTLLKILAVCKKNATLQVAPR